MAISFVNSTSQTSSGNNSSFQIAKPPGVTSGDFLIAAVAHFSSRSEDPEQVIVTPPAGWTMIVDLFSPGVNSIQLSIFTKTAGSSEPSSWTGSYDDTQSTEVQMCAAYRGVAGIADTDTSTIGEVTSFTVGPVSNAQANNWRVVVGAYASNSVSYAIESSEVRERQIGALDPDVGVEMGIWDSNGTVSTGNHSRSISRGSIWGTAAGWIALLDASDVSIPGTLTISALPKPTMSFSGTVGHNATLNADLPLLTMTGSGIATPPAGTLDVLVLPVMDVVSSVTPTGTLDTVIEPVMDVQAETRKFGIRVVTPQAESRVTRPRLGAVD